MVARRFLAGIVDTVLMVGLFVLVAAAAGTIETDDGVRVNLHDGPALVWLAGVFLYYFLTEALTGRTLGKAMLNLRVVRADDGSVPSRGAIAVRTVLRVVDALPLFYGLGAFVVLVNPSRQRIGDLAARTAVVAD